MMKLFETLTFRERWAKIFFGLKQPKETGDYKWAHLQIIRLWSPASGVAVPLIVILLALLLGSLTANKPPVEIRISEEQIKEELKEPEELPEPDLLPDPENVTDPTEVSSTSIAKPGPDADFSPKPNEFDAVAIIRSPVVMKGIFGSRSPGARGSALGRFGGSGHTEGAVLRALRWLKKNQEADGSWNAKSGGGIGKAHNGAQAGLTGMALLTYLAHGETPASPEFGQTVEKAIKYLVEKQGADGKWSEVAYEHPIATYAMCEAFSMTKLPTVQEKAKKGLQAIISGQNAIGGFTYGLDASMRSDSSVMGWCGQALKAGKIAGLDCAGLDSAMKKTLEGFKSNYQGSPDNGTFGYTKPGEFPWKSGGLTGVGVLCNQLLGAAKSSEAKGGLGWLVANDKFDWATVTWKDVYYWYYNTQARFHEGGECWKSWNKAFSVPLVKAQTIIAKGIATPAGKMVDIGYWDAKNDEGGLVMDTALGALMLQVYYRYLPTFQKPEDMAAEAGQGGDKGGTVEAKDLPIDVKL
jgi:hypothetical protein